MPAAVLAALAALVLAAGAVCWLLERRRDRRTLERVRRVSMAGEYGYGPDRAQLADRLRRLSSP